MKDKYHFIAEMAKEIEPQMEWTKEMSHAFWMAWIGRARTANMLTVDPERMMKQFKHDWLFDNQIRKIIDE